MNEDEKRQRDLEEFLSKIKEYTLIKEENEIFNKQPKKLDQIKNQRWYFIKFQSFCKPDINPLPDEFNYESYYVLAEVNYILFKFS
jgi:hypothetical protein